MARGHRALEEAFVEGQVCGLRSTLAEAEATTRVKKFQKRKPPELHHLKLHDPNDPPKAHRAAHEALGSRPPLLTAPSFFKLPAQFLGALPS